MKKKLRKYIILPLLAVLWLCGCGKKEETDKAEAVPDLSLIHISEPTRH